MDESPAPSRRRALQSVAGAGLVLATGGLGACASKPPGPPPPPPAPLNRLAVLPVALTITNRESTGFGARGGPVFIYGGVHASGGNSNAGLAAVLVVGLAALAIGASQARNARVLAQSVTAVNMDPAGYLDQRLAGTLQERGVVLERITDPQLATELRQGGAGRALPPGVDAVLDVRVYDCGFSQSLRFGYTPYLGVQARLLPVGGGDALEDFGYWADARDGKGDRRFITTPPSLNFGSPELIGQQAARVRDELGRVFEQVLGVMAEDVQRRARGETRLA